MYRYLQNGIDFISDMERKSYMETVLAVGVLTRTVSLFLPFQIMSFPSRLEYSLS